MNTDILRFKFHFLSFLLLFSYTYLHFQFTGSYIEIPLEKWLDGTVRLPYGQRFLVPTLARGLSYVIPLSAKEIFFILEWLFISLFFCSLFFLLQQEFPIRLAKLLSWLFILLLPLVTVLNYRFNEGGEAALFFPYDSASLFFTALGFLFCLQKNWIYFIPCVFLATLNRESAFFLILLIPALHWTELKRTILPVFLSSFAFLLAKMLVGLLVYKLPGQWIEWIYQPETFTHFQFNLSWLLLKHNWLVFLYCFAGLPLFWFCFYDFIPERYKPMRYLVLFFFLALLGVGNVMEARIFSEIIVLLYLPVSLGISKWLSEDPITILEKKNVIYYLNRYGVMIILFSTIILQKYFNQGIIWISSSMK